MSQNTELTPEEQAVVEANPELVETKAEFYLTNIMHMTPEKALALSKKHVAVKILRKTDPMYGHDEESLTELYSELKSIEDAESGADREYDYQGTDELDLSAEEIKAYVMKYIYNL